MILCRKPCIVYDVDLCGLGGLVIVGLATWWLVLQPWQRTWHRHTGLVDTRAAVEARLGADLSELETFERELAPLANTVSAAAAEVPRADALPHLLRQIADTARDAELELLSVTPRPATPDGTYLVSDIQMGASGRSHDFIRFLDQLAARNPYQALRSYSIARPAATTQPSCTLAWTVRLYLLPSAAAETTGGEP